MGGLDLRVLLLHMAHEWIRGPPFTIAVLTGHRHPQMLTTNVGCYGSFLVGRGRTGGAEETKVGGLTRRASRDILRDKFRGNPGNGKKERISGVGGFRLRKRTDVRRLDSSIILGRGSKHHFLSPVVLCKLTLLRNVKGRLRLVLLHFFTGAESIHNEFDQPASCCACHGYDQAGQALLAETYCPGLQVIREL